MSLSDSGEHLLRSDLKYYRDKLEDALVELENVRALLDKVRQGQHEATCGAFSALSHLHTSSTDPITEAYNRIAAAPPPTRETE